MSDVILQGTPEWEARRLGKLTASRFHEAIAKLKDGNPGASRKNYRTDLVVQRLRQTPLPQSWVTPAMQWGLDTEPLARAAYAFYRDVEVVETGFIDHPTINMAGCSPDGLVGDDGLVEVKCPDTSQHVEALLGGPIKHSYMIQMHWQLACTGCQWCDWVSFDPRLEESLQFFVKRITRDNEVIAELEREARKFLAEVDAVVERLRAFRMKAAA
jgi:hypothetical protein